MIFPSHWKCRYALCLFFFLTVLGTASADITVLDDAANQIKLSATAHRVVSLAPHTTELLFAAGAGHTVVGVSAWSDYPAQAKNLPVVADGGRLDLERIINLQPDLIIAWKNGSNARQIKRLKTLGFTVFESEPRSLADIASSLERFSTLTGTTEGAQAAKHFREHAQQLNQRYAGRKSLRIFYQIWASPLMTLNDQHLITEVFQLCGATNVFGNLSTLAPSVSTEAVVKANPDAIFLVDAESSTVRRWQAFPKLKATHHNNLFTVNGTLLNRAGPRLLEGAAQLCEHLEIARSHLQER
jgi:iron complex transport system substrate-binding protein